MSFGFHRLPEPQSFEEMNARIAAARSRNYQAATRHIIATTPPPPPPPDPVREHDWYGPVPTADEKSLKEIEARSARSPRSPRARLPP
jgi:hypothetical protein